MKGGKMPDTPTAPPKPSVQFDWTDWLTYVEDSDLTDDQKREMIETLWSIVVAFVDLGWEVIDMPKETSGQTLSLSAALEEAVVYSSMSSETDAPGTLPTKSGKDDAAQSRNNKEPV